MTELEQNEEKKKLMRVEKKVLDIALKIAGQDGALFVIGELEEGKDYELLFPNIFEGKNFNVLRRGMDKLLEKLAQVDGATIIQKDGTIVAVGALIKNSKSFFGAGTRHSAAKTISEKAELVVLVSEEDKNVKLFKGGQLILIMDPETKEIKRYSKKILDFINANDAALIGGGLAATSVLGVPILPGIFVFGGSYYLIRNLIKAFKKEEKK